MLNVYCDESCHLLNDPWDIMAFGAVFADINKCRSISKDIRNIKEAYNCRGELKWNKVSIKNIDFYLELLNYYYNNQDIKFRCFVVLNKNKIDNDKYNDGDHDQFYNKMYYYLLKNIIEYRCDEEFRIFIDIKDTIGAQRIKKLKEVLKNKFKLYGPDIIQKIQQIRSDESEPLQLSDFLMGAISYRNRNLYSNDAKIIIVQKIEQLFSMSLKDNTAPWEDKFNIYHFPVRG